MGIFRLLFTYLMRNEQLINKLADSRPIRRSARLVAYLLLRSRTRGVPLPFNRDELIKRLRSFNRTFREKIQEAKDEMRKNSPK